MKNLRGAFNNEMDAFAQTFMVNDAQTLKKRMTEEELLVNVRGFMQLKEKVKPLANKVIQIVRMHDSMDPESASNVGAGFPA